MYSIVMKSVMRFFQWLICMLLRVFQFMRMVFLAMVRAMRSILEFIFLSVIIVRSPSKQREGDSGMWQPHLLIGLKLQLPKIKRPLEDNFTKMLQNAEDYWSIDNTG